MIKNQILIFILACISLSVWANTPPSLPPSLEIWKNWVLHDTEDYTCAVNYNQSSNPRVKGICSWPSRLHLQINSTEAKFSQMWQLDSAGWIVLPGNNKHWPTKVKINTKDAIVADRNGQASVFATKGVFIITGKFHWTQPPEYLQVPINTGLINLSINNQTVNVPQLDNKGRLWLNKHHKTTDNSSQQNRLDMRVYRRIIDDIPLQVITQIELDVAGRHREIILDSVLLDKQKAMSLTSPLPARLESDGNLRVQVRPGSWTLSLKSRQLGITNSLTAPNKQEIWVFEARNDLRLVEIRGVTAIDPQQTTLPQAWRKFPAYLMQTGKTLQIVEKRRGDPEPAPDQLKLKRDFWLDFDGQGYSIQDHISGTMRQGWRLEVLEPAILGRVAVNGKDQFITRLAENGKTGVEVRRGRIDLVGDSRLENELNQLPAVGWAHDFQKVSANLHLPPGWSLFNATGVDNVPNTWLKKWTLLDLFIVLIIAAAIAKLWRWWWGLLALATMILIYHEAEAPQFIWLNIIAAVALLRVLPNLAWFTSFVRFYRNISIIALLIIVLPFMMQQVRQSIYPQLERPHDQLEYSNNYRPTRARITQSYNAQSSFYEQEYAAAPKVRMSKKVPSKKILQIDPNAQVQTGPGLPQWQWRTVSMDWSGPVQQNQSIKLWLISPTMNSYLSIIRVVLLAILTTFLLFVAFKTRLPSIKPSANGAIASLILFIGLLSYLPVNSYANDNFPPQSMLDELKQRLLAPPDCLPYCANSPRMSLEIKQNILTARMEIHSEAEVAIPLPGSAKQWLPQQILLNGEPAQALLRKHNGQLWLKVTKGIHQVQFTGVLPNRNSVQLALPLKPHFVEVTEASGWRVEGVHENGITDQQLQFSREDEKKLAELEMGELPPFVQVERTLLLGLDWQIETRVIRKTPLGSAIILEVPLLKGESVTSDKIRVENGKALINLSPSQSEIRWLSVFDKQETVTLTAPQNSNSYEIWRLDASAIWHVEIKGIAVIHHQNNQGRWLPQWQAWPGESVSLHITRPSGISGQVITIDRSKFIISPGQRTTNYRLILSLRSSRGMQHKITLPELAQLQSVKINNKTQPIRQEGPIVTLPITPGKQRIELKFQQALGITDKFKTPAVDLGIESVNTNIEIKMPRDRWILFVGGKPIGPAIMIWGLIIVIVILSIGLGQIQLTPLKTHQWLLLGIVLSQMPVAAMLVVIIWLLALGWRAKLSAETPALKFDAIQIGLVILTMISLVILLRAIEQGLLGHPNMHIAGNGSTAYNLNWYQDRISGNLPQVWVYSWSMWFYRIAMLLWALWLSFALLRWLRWGWESFSANGLWKDLRK